MIECRACAVGALILSVAVQACRCSRANPPAHERGDASASRIAEGTTTDGRSSERSTGSNEDARLVATGDQLAMELHRSLPTDHGNMVISPISLTLLLAMAYEGARGETAEQMGRCLLGGLNESQYRTAVKRLLANLQSLELDPENSAPAAKFVSSRSAWVDHRVRIRPGYGDGLRDFYGAELRTADMNRPLLMQDGIRRWIADRGLGRVRLAASDRTSDATDRLLLFDVVDFRASWNQPFPAEKATRGIFITRDGRKVSVPMMRDRRTVLYAKTGHLQVISLAYANSKARMMLALPDRGQMDAGRNELLSTARSFADLPPRFRQVNLVLPPVQFSYHAADTGTAFRACGIERAFTNAADFSGVAEGAPLRLGQIGQWAKVDIHEKGMEATAASIAKVIAQSEPIDFVVDRPFFFLVILEKGPVLFLGEVGDPTVRSLEKASAR